MINFLEIARMQESCVQGGVIVGMATDATPMTTGFGCLSSMFLTALERSGNRNLHAIGTAGDYAGGARGSSWRNSEACSR